MFIRCRSMPVSLIRTWCAFSLGMTSVFLYYRNNFFSPSRIFAYLIPHSLSIKNPIRNISELLNLQPCQDRRFSPLACTANVNSNSLSFSLIVSKGFHLPTAFFISMTSTFIWNTKKILKPLFSFYASYLLFFIPIFSILLCSIGELMFRINCLSWNSREAHSKISKAFYYIVKEMTLFWPLHIARNNCPAEPTPSRTPCHPIKNENHFL